MNLANRDKLISQVKNEIDTRKQKLNKKYTHLTNIEKNNTFLEGVVDDYKTYYNTIVAQKEQQEGAFRNIIDYLDQIIVDNELTDFGIYKAKHQQAKLVKEMENIKRELDDLIKA